MRPRIGHIKFTNCLPLYYGLVCNHVLDDIDLTKGTPRELNRLFIEGELDICAISSIEYARNQRELLLMPALSISSDGPVKSICLVSRAPIGELGGRPVALTNTSATSHILLKIILEDGYGLRARYFEAPPDLGHMLAEADAALLIGDAALHVRYKMPQGLYVYDLGRLWKELTGRKMVYAVWAVHRSFAASQPDVLRRIYHGYAKSMAYGVSHIKQLAREEAGRGVFDAEFLRDYFSTLEFGFHSGHQQGLEEYYRRARDLGYLPHVPSLDFLEV